MHTSQADVKLAASQVFILELYVGVRESPTVLIFLQTPVQFLTSIILV
jgi:hypothetical protein